MITAVNASELNGGDVFSIDGGLTWHVALAPQFGTVTVWAGSRRDAEAPTIRIEADPDQHVLRLGVETRNPWVLHYWCGTDHHVSLHRARAGAIAHLATIVRQKWDRLTNRQILELHTEPPRHDQAAINVYFAGLDGRQEEDYELRECVVQPAEPTVEQEQEYVEGHPDWICVCGNDTTFEGFRFSAADGALVSPDDGGWDAVHYQCMACGRVIQQPTGLVVAGHT